MNQPFPVIESCIHLNHAAIGPWPQATADTVQSFATENAQFGSLHYPSWLKTEQYLRGNLAQLINAESSEEIALVKNTSEGLSFVAYGLNWQTGDNVVGIQQEFPSNRFAWESLSDQGVTFRKLDLGSSEDPEQGLFDLCDERTRLISISAVQYHNGFRMDLSRVGEFCRERGVLFCVDAIQQLGALPFDVQAIGADFIIADGHKWLLAPEGLGLFYVRKAVMEQLSIKQFGWHMVENLGDYTQQDFALAHTARRFECGSPNMLGIHALNASVELLLETGKEFIGGRVLENTRYLIDQFSSVKGIRVLSNNSDSRLSGIVTFRSEFVASEQLYRLLSEQGVFCAPRGGGIRLSPHFYTPREQLEQVVSLIKDFS